MAEKKKLTQKGVRALKDELKQLKEVGRDEIKAKLKEARAQGDLSENAEYDAAKDEQGAMENRIIEIEELLENVEIIAAKTVTVLDVEENEEITYMIVGSSEADSMQNLISQEAPLGKILSKASVGDTVTVSAPGGDFEYKVLNIEEEDD